MSKLLPELQEKSSREPLTPNKKNRFVLITAFEIAKREIDNLSKFSESFSPLSTKKKSEKILSDMKSQTNKYILKVRTEEKKNESRAYRIYKEELSKSYSEETKPEKKSHSFGILERRLSNAKKYKQKMEELEEEYSKAVLNRINDRLEKSCINYSRIIEQKKGMVKKEKSRAQSLCRVNEGRETFERHTLERLLMKRQISEERKTKFMSDLQERINRKHLAKEKQMVKAQENVKQQQKALLKRTFDIEKRLKAVQQFQLDKKNDLEKQIKSKIEKNKLKEVDMIQKSEQKKYEEQLSKEQIIEKLQNDREFFEKTKEKKEYMNNQIREKSIRQMIEKEKINDAISFFRKSTKLSSLQEKLKELNVTSYSSTQK